MMRIHTQAFMISVGLVFGLIICLKTLAAFYFGWGIELLELVSSGSKLYTITPMGSLFGLAYGFISGAIVAGMIALFYNKLFVRI